MDERRIFLARHGQTFHNAAAGESYGDADRLSPTGHDQARRLGRLLAGHGVTAIVTSPLARARETAEGINETLGCPVEEDERLIEIVPPAHADDDPEREAEHWSVYMERALATVLESIALEDDIPADERRHRLDLHYRLIDDLT